MKNITVILENLKTSIKKLPKTVWIIIVAAFVAGLLISGDGSSENQAGAASQVSDAESNVEFWTCAMHPQIKLPESGQCPICFMDLIPLETSGGEEGPRELKMSNTAMALADISTTPVRRGMARSEVMLSGKVEYDETRVKTITTWVPGRLEHLYVDYTGISVKKGDHLVDIYSPDLYAAQEELIQALKQVKNGNSGLVRESAQITLDAAREKLSLLGLTANQIQDVEKGSVPQDRLTIYSPLAGVVIHKNAVEGRYVKTGSAIYTIADLSRVWVILDAYESDLPWLRFGQDVKFTTEALPGEIFTGRITFIDPILDNKTRTVKVRINIANTDGKLKPGMFVRAKVESVLDINGKAVNPQLGGKWIGPMHPEIVKDKPGKCDICGMDLVATEDFGIVAAPTEDRQPLLIPASAVLKTGKQALVYVKVPNRSQPTFESRQVMLGPRAGNDYIVLSGLNVGEEVVTKGNFKIDSAMQIAAKPSMMSPEGGVAMTGHAGHGDDGKMKSMNKSSDTSVKKGKNTSAIKGKSEKLKSGDAFRNAITPIYEIYFTAQTALSSDDLDQAKNALSDLNHGINALSDNQLGLSGASLDYWKNAKTNILGATEHAQHWSSIEEVREAFKTVSSIVIDLEKSLGHGGQDTFFELFCSMAFDKTGASWLQTDKSVNNPYYGTKMSRCGELKSELKPVMDMSSMGKGESHE